MIPAAWFGIEKPDAKTRTRLRGMGYEVTLHIYAAEFEDEFGEIESDRVIETCRQHELVALVDAYTSDEEFAASLLHSKIEVIK